MLFWQLDVLKYKKSVLYFFSVKVYFISSIKKVLFLVNYNNPDL